MTPAVSTLTIRFSTADSATCRVDLEGPDVGERRGPFAPPYNAATWQAIMLALEPGFVLSQADKTVQAALKPLGDIADLPRKAGAALANALLADEEVRLGFAVALGRAEAMRRPLPVEMRFGAGCDALAALPWELLYYKDRFLLADTSIALSRYPEGAIPPTPALGELPLRVLLVLSEPIGASPIFPERAREELLHGLRSLDEAGAVVVDLLRPPTFSTLVEAVTNGGYHMLVFYGHGGYDPEVGGLLLFEDEFGGRALIKASELGAALRNTDVRLVLLGACQSATTADLSGTGNPTGLNIWSGTAPALVRAGVPLAIGMQVSMRVDAAQVFIRQFALSLAAGKPVIAAVGDARKPIIRGAYGEMWYAPALYGRPVGDTRLFDPQAALPVNTADLRAEMKTARSEIERLEKAISGVGMLGQPAEIAQLRQARTRFAQARTEVARRTPGGYAAVVSPVYGVPTNPIFVGRTQELHDVAQAFVSGHPVVIWGAGGIGKSALAAEVAHRQSWRFPGGVLWLDCRGGPAFDSLLNQIGAFAGIEAIDKVEPDKKEVSVKWALARLDARCLLVWDNAEEVWDERAVRRFVEGLPANCQALLTTRENPEQAMWPTVELAPLSGVDMHDLFYRLAAAAGVKVGSQDDRDAIPLILNWLQGHPLALALVVPLAMKRGLQRVWTDLQARPLKGIEAAFEVSYQRLSAREQRVFGRLSVFRIPFDWPAAEAVMAGQTGVDAALDALVQHALLSFNGSRYAYHTLLRQYAYEKLKRATDPRPVHRLAAQHLQDRMLDPKLGATPEEAFEAVEQWHSAERWEQLALFAQVLGMVFLSLGYWDTVQQCTQRARTAVNTHLDSRPDLIADLYEVEATVARRRARWEEARGLWEKAAIYHERAGRSWRLAGSYNDIGLTYFDKGDFDIAIAYHEKALLLADQYGDMPDAIRIKGLVYNGLGNVYARKGEWDRSIDFLTRDLAICEQFGNEDGMAITYGDLGLVYTEKGELDRALECYRQMIPLASKKPNSHYDLALAMNNIGNVYLRMGNLDRAIEFYQRSLDLKLKIGDVHGAAISQMNLGTIFRNKGDWIQGIRYTEAALNTMQKLGDDHYAAAIAGNLGQIYLDQGACEQAMRLFQVSLTKMEQSGDVPGLARARMDMGNALRHQRAYARAKEMYQKALETFERLGDSASIAHCHGGLGQSCFEMGELGYALDHYRRALTSAERSGDQHLVVTVQGHVGAVLERQGDWRAALRTYEEMLRTSEVTSDPRNVIAACGCLGHLYLQMRRWREANEYYQRCFDVSEQANHFAGRAQALLNLGSTWFMSGDLERAEQYYRDAIKALREVGDNDTLAQTYISQSVLYLKRKEPACALTCSEQALQVAQQCGNVPIAGRALLEMGDAHSALRDWQKAVTAYQQAVRMLSSAGEPDLLHTAEKNLALARRQIR